MKKQVLLFTIIAASLLLIAAIVIAPTTIEDFFLPGSQIGQSGNIETPDRCDNCHGGYDIAIEPAFNWRGSMMAQAARDPLFYACLAIAEQDAPGVGDMCLRCHTPDGWLNGRCVPTDGSALNNNDRQGVQCDFCHKMVKPTPLGVNPYPLDNSYKTSVYGTIAYNQDQSYLTKIIPLPGESGNGMYIVDANNAKRGPFTNASGRHQMIYSPFHRDAAHCGTCHDVSNPVLTRNSTGDLVYSPNEFSKASPTFAVAHMFPIERTYGEWKASGYNAPGTSNHKTCQDCHMRDVTGKAASMKDAVLRTDMPLHDFTGGNTFVPKLVKLLYPAEVNAAALDAGIERARNNLKSATKLELELNSSTKEATVKVTNNTGHKFPTGYPEGRRAWINLIAYDGSGKIIYESGAYNSVTAELSHYDKVLINGTLVEDKTLKSKIYHCEPGISVSLANTLKKPELAGPSFHMALNDMIVIDNRIPPAGYTNSKLNEYQSPSVGYSYPDNQNWDITSYSLPTSTAKVEVKLYYQTTSKEFVEFLRDENKTNSRGLEIYNLWDQNGKSAPELMNEATWPFVQPSVYANILSVTRTSSKQGVNGQAVVMITDNTGVAISGASVSASFTGPTSGMVTGTTDIKGQVILKSTTIKSATGIWCFTVTNVTKTGYSYPVPTPTLCETVAKSAIIAEQPISKGMKVYPNPFNEKVRFEFVSTTDANAVLDIFDATGRQVKTIFKGTVKNGSTYIAEFEPETQVGGIYMYRLKLGDKVYNGKVLYKK